MWDSRFVRWAFTIWLLSIVRQHAHWSVMMALAVTFVGVELETMLPWHGH